MQASDYPVTFAYGAKDGYYYGPNGIAGPYHRGDDRAMPDNTEVKVNGHVIGLSGHSGLASGPHLHTGRFVNGKDTDPKGGGFKLSDSATVVDVGYNATSGNFVKVRDGEVVWFYGHLSVIKATMNQQLIGGPMLPPINQGDIVNGWRGIKKTEANPNDISYWTLGPRSNDWKALYYEMVDFAEKNLVLKGTTTPINRDIVVDYINKKLT